MKQLISGTTRDDCLSTLPAMTRIISISVMDKVCYVNLDETFLNDQNSEITEQVILYSIVNSLTELPDVEKVQIAVNGDTSQMLRYQYELSAMYEYNEALLEIPAAEEETETQPEASESEENQQS